MLVPGIVLEVYVCVRVYLAGLSNLNMDLTDSQWQVTLLGM